jgi:hypothetical protein
LNNLEFLHNLNPECILILTETPVKSQIHYF